MKKSDCAGIGFFVLFCLLVLFFPLNYGTRLDGLDLKIESLYWTGFTTKGLSRFGAVTGHFPYIMGFFKFAILATFGEMLKSRIKSGSWRIPAFFLRVIVWGFFGIVMTLAFALFAQGVGGSQGFGGLMNTHFWFNPEGKFAHTLTFALTTSCLMNFIFAYPMMLAHEWCNSCMTKKSLIGGEEFFRGLDPHVWGSFIPKTILYFWIPAHTVTFFLPGEFRVLSGALLSTALGFILTIAAKKN